MPTGFAVQAVLQWEAWGEECLNVIHFQQQNPGSVTQSDVNAIGQGIRDAFDMVDGYMETLTDDVALTGVAVRDLRTPAQPLLQADFVPLSGPGASSETFTAMCQVVTLYTAVASRRGRGRIYLVPPGTSNFSGGQFLNGPQADNTMEALKSIDVNGWGYLLSVLSRVDNVVRPVTNTEVRSQIPGIQRRRSKRP